MKFLPSGAAVLLVLDAFLRPTLSASAWAGSVTSAPAQEVLQRTSQAFNEVARKATPAVVAISAVHATPASPTSDSPGKGMGIGSGIIIRSDGIILTSNHVVEGADEVSVALDDKKRVKARVLGTDPKTDVAILALKEKRSGLPTLSFGNSDDIRVGDWAIAVGNPFGLSHTVTSGIISAKGRAQMGMIDTEDFIQTDAAINPGNSGGPLLNLEGKVIGLNAAIFSQTGGFIGIGFAIPANLVKKISDEIIDHGRVVRGWIGVVAQDLDEDLTQYFKVKQGSGALIADVNPEGPAAQSALKTGDVIVEFNQKPVKDSSELKDLVTRTQAGSRVKLSIRRGGEPKDLVLTVQEQPGPPVRPLQLAGQAAPARKKPTLGLATQDLPPEFRQMLDLGKKGGALIVGVKPGSIAFEAGLAPGDVILQANSKEIRSAREFTDFAKALKEEELAVLHVQRGSENKIFIPLKLSS